MSDTKPTKRNPGTGRSRIAPAVAAFFFFALAAPLLAGERDLAAERALERKCIDCHDEPALHGSRPDGKLRSVFVDPDLYKKSIHTEKDLTCLSCHPDATDEFHCREGVTITACGSCHDHEDELADFAKSRHGRHLENKVENAADCQHCHTNHYCRKKDEPESSIHKSNIRRTCGSCHETEARFTESASWLRGGRFAAHGKADLSERYEIDDCSRCHFGPDAHKQRKAEEIERCAACHRRDDPSGSRPAIGAAHFDAGDVDAYVFSSLRALGRFAAMIAPLLLLGFAVAFRRSIALSPSKKPSDAKEGAPDA